MLEIYRYGAILKIDEVQLVYQVFPGQIPFALLNEMTMVREDLMHFPVDIVYDIIGKFQAILPQHICPVSHGLVTTTGLADPTCSSHGAVSNLCCPP